MSEETRDLDLEPHAIIRESVGTHDTGAFARFVGTSRSSAEKWMREPASDEEPNATGIVNPIERTDRIFDWLLLNRPAMAVLLSERYARRLRKFRDRQAQQPLTHTEQVAQLTKLIDEHADVLKALVAGAPVAEVRREFAQFQDAFEELLSRREAEGLRQVS